MLATNSTLFWKKKEFVSYILSILVFLIHISSFSQHEQSGTLITDINQTVSYFFKESITRFAVPAFFILSGATFFRNFSYASYPGKLKSRLYTLVIPYLVWNTVWMLFDITCSYTFLHKFFISKPRFEITLINILKGIFLYECNLSFWFIFNLIIFTVFSPAINFLISRKGLAFISLGCIVVLRVFGTHILSGISFGANSLVYYFIGAIVGKYYWGKFTQKSNSLTQYLSVAFLCLYFIAKTIHRAETTGTFTPLWEIIIFSLSTFCLWNSVDLIIDKVGKKPFLSRSFAVYAMHTNISAVIAKLFALILHKNEFFAIPNMIFTLTASLIFINLFCIIAERYFPKSYLLIMGKQKH